MVSTKASAAAFLEVNRAGRAAQPTDEGGEAAEGRMEVDVPEAARLCTPRQGESFSPRVTPAGLDLPSWQPVIVRNQEAPFMVSVELCPTATQLPNRN